VSDARVTLARGGPALDLLRDESFLEGWRVLHREAEHATAFQSPAFVSTWYEAYRSQWEPVVLSLAEPTGALRGLWLLAYDPAARALAHAGAHQAEYHAWLTRPGEASPFLSAAWAELERSLPFAALRFRYLPAASAGETLRSLPGLAGRVLVRRCPRPLQVLDPGEVKASFAKRSNKSRFNRLKRLGSLEFRRLVRPSELEPVFDDLIDFYDLRQGAVNRTCPFREDPHKRPFHIGLFTAAPEETCVTITCIDDRPVAGFWGAVGRGEVHLGMLMYSPLLAEHSPGKLHVMQLTQLLLEQGIGVLDLTPGGDPWKERFANRHDEVAEATIYRSAWGAGRARASDRIARAGKRTLARLGLAPSDVRGALARVREAAPAAVLSSLRSRARARRGIRIYRADRELAERLEPARDVRVNSLADLLSFEPSGGGPTREEFLSGALGHLERGDIAFTLRVESRLALCAWMESGPEDGARLGDFYVRAELAVPGLLRAFIGRMLREAFARKGGESAYVAVDPFGPIPPRELEAMGFRLHGTLVQSPGSGQAGAGADVAPGGAEASDAPR
jgi:CelD/BcsL family acetyltransferase involved in cellulose biosynthesis